MHENEGNRPECKCIYITQTMSAHATINIQYRLNATSLSLGAAVAQLAGHRPGNREIPGLVPGFNSRLLLCFLGQETSSATQLLNWDILSLYVAGHS